jgi:hypothetical protein
VDLASKLQIKPGSAVATVGAPASGPDLSGLEQASDPAEAGAVLAFVQGSADLTSAARAAIEAARQDKLSWIAYPKAGQLGTDLNRDRIAEELAAEGIRPVRQVALDDVWSALRFRPA